MTLSKTPFEKFVTDCQDSGSQEALGNLADFLIEQKRFHELFEVRKLQLRQQLQLPIDKWQAIDELPAEKGRLLETGLLDICREVGTLHFRNGLVAEGWQYLEPVGDGVLLSELIRKVEVTDENAEALIQLTIGQGVETELGFSLVLDRFGTCSSITTYESQLAMQPLKIRRGPATLLVNHLYNELRGRLQQTIQQHEDETNPNQVSDNSDCSIDSLISEREWMFEGLGHHIDTTHLASTVRISKIVTDPNAVEQAIELARYGLRLHEDFQYSGQAPFENIHRDSLEFLSAMKGIESESAIERLQGVAVNDQSSVGEVLDAAVWLVYLLDQMGDGTRATRAYFQFVHEQQSESMPSEDVCPNMMHLISKYEEFAIAKSDLERVGDLLGYATVCSIENQRTAQ